MAMAKVRAIRITKPGGPEVLQLGEYDVPDPGPGQVAVRVAAGGINRADLLQRRGLYPAPLGAPADIPGLEYAGTVEAVGAGVVEWTEGDRVMGIVAGGGLAERVIVHAREAIRVPEGMDLEIAAAVPEAFMTAFDALFVRGRARVGEWVVVHAAGSGVGTAALQLATASGMRPIATSRTEAKLQVVADLGVEDRVLVSDDRFADRIIEITGTGADVVMDFVGASYLAENLKAAAVLGRIVVIGLMGGATGEIPLGLLLRKRLTMTGTVLRARPLEEKASLAQRFAREALPLFESGRLAPVIDCVEPMASASKAHERMEANQNIGKIVLTW